MKPVSLSAAPVADPAAVVPIALVAALPSPIPLDRAAPPGVLLLEKVVPSDALAPDLEAPAPVLRADPPPLPAARASAAAPPPAPPSFPPGTAFTGEVLRRAREARGLTVQQLADRTRITRHHLENVEADRYEKLPPTVYLRGILTSVAKELRLDAGAVAQTYLDARAASGAVGNGR